MEIIYKTIVVSVLLVSTAYTMPVSSIMDKIDDGSMDNIKVSQSSDSNPIVIKPSTEYKKDLGNYGANSLVTSSANDGGIKKRNIDEIDDLEMAAGTNVLRPLFVYRQQLAYRDRVKKGAARRPSIGPIF